MKWMIPEAKLGPEQREIIDELSSADGKPMWIQGHAGSGKSVVLIHALSDYLIRNKNHNVIVVVYTRSLIDLVRNGINQIPSLSKRFIPVVTLREIKRNFERGDTYDAIFCDEVQDLHLELLIEMNESSKQLVLSGDSMQSLYEEVVGFKAPPAKTDEIIEHISPVEKKSNTIYRLTQSTIDLLKNVYPDLLEDKVYSGKEDSQIRLFEHENMKEEVEFVWNECMQNTENRPEEVNAILVFKNEDIVWLCNQVLELNDKTPWVETKNRFGKTDFYKLNRYLEENSIPLMFVGTGTGLLAKADKENKVIIMTYHSAKGLDFDAVALPFLSTDIYTTNLDALILVALSRSKRDLLLTYSGELNSGFWKFLKDISPQTLDDNDDEILF